MLIADDALDDLVALVRVPTERPEQLPAFRAALEQRFPRVLAALEVELVGDTILARWPGRGGGAPALLMAHQDVVPAPETGWTHPPYSGHRDATHVWGRGTLDDKGSLVAILVAIQSLLADGFAPERDVWLVLGHDEETMGTGAERAIAELAARGVRPAWALDEGGAIVEPPIAGLERDVAVVGVALALWSRGRIAPSLAMVWGLTWIAVGRLADEPASTATGIAAIIAALAIGAATAVARIRAGGGEPGSRSGRWGRLTP
ncbi:M20/M25/M40 family metallo-hydrolase [Agrococcus sp. HG114]|uniref:M20/M25/M40 family metallo-hydrolase n=1 Tax=Agrococcus sp. HG114 TaxID=2969757 RepID=UPI00215B4938|nr:M20/M25/M40 family metallo-hydrolase [Agrococcus sp. HG114]MCR8670621.1 M20/M25/M40 family metallo-hydrolase [Agrococcus sp. HG114]